MPGRSTSARQRKDRRGWSELYAVTSRHGSSLQIQSEGTERILRQVAYDVSLLVQQLSFGLGHNSMEIDVVSQMLGRLEEAVKNSQKAGEEFRAEVRKDMSHAAMVRNEIVTNLQTLAVLTADMEVTQVNIESMQAIISKLQDKIEILENWRQRGIGMGLAVGAIGSIITALMAMFFQWLLSKSM